MSRIMARGLLLALLGAAIPFSAMSVRAQEEGREKASPKAQDAAPAAPRKSSNVYRVDYAIREMEGGKVLNSRKYMLMAEDQQWARTRVGSQVPLLSGTGEVKQLQYRDVGMNIDCRVREKEDRLLLDTTVESSGVAPSESSSVATSTGNPVFRRVNSTVTAAVSLGKPTLIGSMDDVTSNHRYEIEVTVTQVK